MVIFKHFPVTIYQNLVHKCHNKPVTKVKQIVVIIDASKLRKFPHNVRIVDQVFIHLYFPKNREKYNLPILQQGGLKYK